MAQWGNTDTKADAPKFVADATTGKTGYDLYNDTVFGLEPSEAEDGAGSPGWVKVVKGEGSITDLVLVDGGADYANTDTITVGTDSATIETDGDGKIVTINFTPSGDKYDATPNVVITTDAGAGAEITVIMDGRIGRVWTETLVAMRGIH